MSASEEPSEGPSEVLYRGDRYQNFYGIGGLDVTGDSLVAEIDSDREMILVLGFADPSDQTTVPKDELNSDYDRYAEVGSGKHYRAVEREEVPQEDQEVLEEFLQEVAPGNPEVVFDISQ